MRNIFLILLVSFSLQAFTQDDSIEMKMAPTTTAIGKPVGAKISDKFDNGGGRIFSADKNVELFIPRDALSKKIEISIQAVENTLSPGKGRAYHFEPAGINFLKPVQIRFHYSAKEDTQMPDMRNIAWQDDSGQWFALDSCDVDTVAKTVTAHITHFSTWLFFDYFNLDPLQARVKVGKQLNLVITCTYPGRSGPFTEKTIPKIKFTTYVNGIRGGNGVVGTVSGVRSNNYRNINYKAPATVPDNNPVAVSVEASNITFNGRTYSKLKLVSNISIYDIAYLITVTGHNEQNVLSCTISGTDTATCVLELAGKKTKLLDIENKDYAIKINGCDCKIEEINPGTSSGPINIIGASKIETSYDSVKQVTAIVIYFMHTVGVIPGMRRLPCYNLPEYSYPAQSLPAVPFVLQFETNSKEQTIMEGGDKRNGFEVKVRPLYSND